jgi:hypothetical protein
MSLRFGNDLKRLNVDYPRGRRSMERDGVHLNLVRVAEQHLMGAMV